MNKLEGPNGQTTRARKAPMKVERLDALYPGFATATRILLDQGVSATKAAQVLHERFSAPISASAIAHYRKNRWLPDRNRQHENTTTLEAFYHQSGAERGLDLAAFARIRELLDTANIREATAIRLTLLKIRAQDLKEEEFRFRLTRQTGDSQSGEDDDPAAEEAKMKNVVNKIRAIFALPALAEDDQPEPSSDEQQAQREEETPEALPVEGTEETSSN